MRSVGLREPRFMKMLKLLESNDNDVKADLVKLRRCALTLQDELPEVLDVAIDITLSKASPQPRWFHEAITMHLDGPLFELYMDILYMAKDPKDGSKVEWMLQVRTDKDEPSMGIVLLTSDHDPQSWFTPDRIVKRLLEKKPSDSDMRRYNFLWFDKIKRNLDKPFELLLKSIVVNHNEIMTAQVLKKDGERVVDRWALSFEHHGGGHGFCYRLKPWGALESTTNTVRDFSDINEMLHENE